eukprot:COSAG06_NODE_360_length_16832_cov_9.250209_8_plen_117_part_00
MRPKPQRGGVCEKELELAQRVLLRRVDACGGNPHPHADMVCCGGTCGTDGAHGDAGQRMTHVAWGIRRRQTQSNDTQPPPRCSRSASPTLLIAPAARDPEGLPGAGRLQSRSETAA